MNIEIKNFDNLTNGEKETLVRLVKKANEKSKVFKPTSGKEYYLITSEGFICSNAGNKHDHLDGARFQLGNCFETREEAEFALEKQKVYTELKRYALEHDEFEIKWNDIKQKKWSIYIDHTTNFVFPLHTCEFESICGIYFTSYEIAKNAIAEIGEDRIKKYLFEVVER